MQHRMVIIAEIEEDFIEIGNLIIVNPKYALQLMAQPNN